MEETKAMLDKTKPIMVKYCGIGYRVERKEYLFSNQQRAGAIGWKPGQGREWESASGSEAVLSDK